ncbi:hypothetical protein BD769DRAFT_1065804 [Suillus cothurnatus]|nr:hypothetical protein BD769DRAFT_1065804 [Suillus cothurnatus]
MIMESLLKVLLILSSAIALHVSFTTENVPSNKEVVRQTFNEWIFTRLVRYAFPTIKAFYWVVSFAEIAIIVLHLTDPDSVPIIRDTPINFPSFSVPHSLSRVVSFVGGVIAPSVVSSPSSSVFAKGNTL